jgi:hypothetical protein
MNRNALSTIIGSLIMFLVFFFLKLEISYIICFIALVLLGSSILKYFEYNEKIGAPLSAIATILGLILMYIQFKLNYFALGLFVLLLIVLWASNLKYYSKSKNLDR